MMKQAEPANATHIAIKGLDDVPAEPPEAESVPAPPKLEATPLLRHSIPPPMPPEPGPSEPAPAPEFERHSLAPTPHPDEAAAAVAHPGPAEAQQPPEHIEALHIGAPKRRRKWPMLVLGLLVILIAVYLAIDSGLIKTSVNLPLHVFKQKTKPAAATVATSPPPSAPVIPPGFTKYSLANTPIVFAAPTAWGTPTSANDPGYTIRGGTNKTDGTYAYIVTFATNKDIQVVVTSSKYLPTAPGNLYYDFLQWCVGTNDGKVYLNNLHYNTSNGIDTPTTISCDQGPLTDATKLDSTTMVQLKVLNTANQVIGDIYTKNLSDTDLPVLRVKDAAMTNGDDIKQLLNTVQIASQ